MSNPLHCFLSSNYTTARVQFGRNVSGIVKLGDISMEFQFGILLLKKSLFRLFFSKTKWLFTFKYIYILKNVNVLSVTQPQNDEIKSVKSAIMFPINF